MIGLIGWSEIYDIEGTAVKKDRKISTPFGAPSDSYRIAEISGIEVAFLPRHGSPHHIAPHKINYRANIWGFKELGVERIISVNAVGGINPKYKPGDIVILNQIIDMSEGRAASFYDEGEIVHVDFTEPYCPELKAAMLAGGKKAGIAIIKEGATYVCTNGPRLETAAEIKAFSLLGADVVGMTGMPEAALARELALCFAGFAVITNYAAGTSAGKLTTTEVKETIAASTKMLKSILKETISLIPANRNCACKDALTNAKM